MSVEGERSPRSELTDSLSALDTYVSNFNEDLMPFDALIFQQIISQVKFPVMKGYLSKEKKDVAVKLFPFQDQKINTYYLNESCFINLRHENIISILHCEQEREIIFDDCEHKTSYIIMELAPYGDLFDLVIQQKIQMDEKLIRTFFHQLIEGLEYLHNSGVVHLDLKLDNILIGQDFKLKICDFDQACNKNESIILSNGTECYRAPEIVNGRCYNPEAADIYSMGIILFTLKSGGCLPYLETEQNQGVNMFNLMINNVNLFWKKTCKLQKKGHLFYDEDFKRLFISMVSLNPQDRPTIKQIKESKWYQGSVYSYEQFQILLKENLLNC